MVGIYGVEELGEWREIGKADLEGEGAAKWISE